MDVKGFEDGVGANILPFSPEILWSGTAGYGFEKPSPEDGSSLPFQVSNFAVDDPRDLGLFARSAAYEMKIRGDKVTVKDLRTELSDSKEELNAYKDENEDCSKTVQELLEVRRKQVKVIADLKNELALA